jgi:5,10-methylenetetrahydrofolate reductase
MGRFFRNGDRLVPGALSATASAQIGRVFPMGDRFDVVCEVEPATGPDLRMVRHQIGVLSSISSTFLIPDNHIGRATVSSIAVVHEVLLMGGIAIACLNARDRNTLGFRRDLLTAAAYGVREFLFVYGDRPECGRRSDDLTVRTMIEQARLFAAEHYADTDTIRIGVSSGLGPVPAWKNEADFLFAQAASLGIDCCAGARRSPSTARCTPGSWWWLAPGWVASSAPTYRNSLSRSGW